MLDKLNIRYINSLGTTREANCWGSTQYALGYIKEPIWQHPEPMEDFLAKKTIPAIGRKKGDILVMRYNGHLVHTATYYSPNNWWHKPGGHAAEFASIEKINKTYEGDYDGVEYRRFIGGTLEEDMRNESLFSKVIKRVSKYFIDNWA